MEYIITDKLKNAIGFLMDSCVCVDATLRNYGYGDKYDRAVAYRDTAYADLITEIKAGGQND